MLTFCPIKEDGLLDEVSRYKRMVYFLILDLVNFSLRILGLSLIYATYASLKLAN